jgi:geranylgeranyl diphosphate synthase, type II
MGYDPTTAVSKKKINNDWHQTNAARRAIDIRRYFRERKSLIDTTLNQYLKSNSSKITPLLHEAMCYSALDAGKRFRPILTLAVGDLFGAKRAPVLSFACAIELIHCYSLIHDDLPSLDNDDFRRGKPSCHKRFGEAIALLAGDALLTEAFFIVSDPALARTLGDSVSAKLIREISESAGMRGMINGQSKEFDLENCKVTADILESLDRLKTGALITTAARVGAMIGGATHKDLDRITRYAQSLGLAFQITDDILDEHEISKDDHKGIANYLSVAGKAKANERVQSLFVQCLKEIEPYGKAAETLREIARYVTERTL